MINNLGMENQMNTLLENNMIEEIICGNNIAYVLQDNSYFLPTEYKVLLSQGEGKFVKCMKMLYNGNIEFYYLLNGYKTFESMVPLLDEDGFMAIMSSLFNNVLEVKNNGFLKCRNIDARYSRIFVNPNTYQVSLLYLPAKISFYQDDYAFENEMRTNLVKLIATHENLDKPRLNQFSSDLSNGMLTLQDITLKLKGGKIPSNGGGALKKDSAKLKIVAINAPTPISIDVNKDEFVLGKKQDKVDYAITFNRMISRIHCKVNKTNNGFTITDLQSSNGTYVNKKRLAPNQPHTINNGDIIRMANSDFQVVIK